MILAIDSSSKTASTALVRGGALIAESFQNTGLTHSQTLVPMIEDMLKNTGVSPGDISRVIVTNGPGSFTGLRIGVAAALGWAEARGIPCEGVSTLEAAARAGAQQERLICAVMDARRSEVYNALFMPSDGGITRLCEDRAMPLERLERELDGREVFLVGDGAAMCAGQPGRVLAARPHVSAFGAALCALAGNVRPAENIVYLRLPQAERELLERNTSGGINNEC